MLRFIVCVQAAAPAASLSVGFEAAAAALEALPRLFFEPDGSFVWRGTANDGQPWQVDGNLIDRGDVLSHVELNGCCPTERFDDLLRALGWPNSALSFQLPRRGIVLTEDEFRRLTSTEFGAV